MSLMDLINITVKGLRDVRPTTFSLNNQNENKATKLVFNFENEDLDKLFKYIVFTHSMDENLCYICPLLNNEFLIRNDISSVDGQWSMQLIFRDYELNLDKDIIELETLNNDELTIISKPIICRVKKTTFDAEVIKNLPMDENLQIVYDDLVRLKSELTSFIENGGSGGTTDYNQLNNLPKINNVELKGNLTTEDLGIVAGDGSPEIYIGSGEMPDGYKVQIDPNGEATIVDAVKDVKINDTSIVSDGVANIPIADAQNKLGLVKTVSGYGVVVNGEGMLGIDKADTTNISNRNNGFKPITATNLDYAVKTAICDGKGTAWTTQEKASARARLGSEWRYIGKVETTEDVAAMEIALDSEGNPFNLRKVRVLFVNMPNAGDNTNISRLQLSGVAQTHVSTPAGVKSTETARASFWEIDSFNGKTFTSSYFESMNATTGHYLLQNKMANRMVISDIETAKITEFNKIGLIVPGGTLAIGAGAYIEVWGVDA